MILFLQQHKSPKEIQENETVAHLALSAFCCGWQLCQTSFVYHMFALLYHMICVLCVCVGIHIFNFSCVFVLLFQLFSQL